MSRSRVVLSRSPMLSCVACWEEQYTVVSLLLVRHLTPNHQIEYSVVFLGLRRLGLVNVFLYCRHNLSYIASFVNSVNSRVGIDPLQVAVVVSFSYSWCSWWGIFSYSTLNLYLVVIRLTSFPNDEEATHFNSRALARQNHYHRWNVLTRNRSWSLLSSEVGWQFWWQSF